jgi:hypothetical protein
MGEGSKAVRRDPARVHTELPFGTLISGRTPLGLK